MGYHVSILLAAQCFLVLHVERLDVPYGRRMVPWLCFVALFARDVGIGIITIIPFGLYWSLYLFLYLYLYVKRETDLSVGNSFRLCFFRGYKVKLKPDGTR
jgi:hypothetical protein